MVHFDIDPFRKHCLLNGLDDIGLTEQKSTEIATYETEARHTRPWLFGMIQARILAHGPFVVPTARCWCCPATASVPRSCAR